MPVTKVGACVIECYIANLLIHQNDDSEYRCVGVVCVSACDGVCEKMCLCVSLHAHLYVYVSSFVCV